MPVRNSLRQHIACVVSVCATLLAGAEPAFAQFSQQGPKLVGSGALGDAEQGTSVAVSADGTTAIVGGWADNGFAGAAWVWTRSGGVWTQQGPKLVGSGAVGNAMQGNSVALSADGTTALVGGPADNDSAGAAWVWTRSGGVWTQQGPKLVGSGAVGNAAQGNSVALSADGTTALVGGPADNDSAGAAWVWTRSGGVWTQQGPKLVGSGGALGPYGSALGWSVALSADGTTALVGGAFDNNFVGAAWVWTRSGGVWTQQGSKLVGSGAVGNAAQGISVALSADGTTALVGGDADNANDSHISAGAVWVWTRSGGVWTQQGPKLVGSGAVGNAYQGASVALSADGTTALVGGPVDNSDLGAAWVWTRSGGVWTQQGAKLVGSGAVGNATQGTSVALSADGTTALVGGAYDNNFVGAAWVFVVPPPPTIGPLPNVLTRINTSIAVPITVGSAGAGGPAGVTLTGTSSNPTLVPNANLVFSGSGASRTLTITPAANQRGVTTITVSASDSTGTTSTSFVLQVGTPRSGDFDGDGRADTTVFRPSTGVWHTMRSTTGTPTAFAWGNASDKPVVGDFDGDGQTDIAVFRPSNGTWYIVPSTTGVPYGFAWGNGADVPVPGDYDGDGKTDIAVFRPSNGVWYVLPSTTGVPYGFAWGNSADLPVPGDYDGDGKTDIAVFRPWNGTWYVVPSTTGVPYGFAWGNWADVPVPGDYDGDGKTDIAVFRPSNGTWYVVPSTTGVPYGFAWGNSADTPVPGDYDGDGRTDIAVFRPSNGVWYVVPSTTGVPYGFAWGNSADIPIFKKP